MRSAEFTSQSIGERSELIAVRGELDAANARELRRHVDVALAAGCDALVIDLEQLDHLDSSGLAELIGAHQRIRNAGGRLVLAFDTGDLRRLMEIRGLDGLFQIAPTRAAAPALVLGEEERRP